MKQYRITSDNISQDSPDDCHLSPEDPIHKLKISSYMGGLGSETKLQEYKAKLAQPVLGSNKGQIQREMGINPGTEEWFQLWFGRNK